jgi:hypothetical protein
MATLHQAVCTGFELQACEAGLGIYQKAGFCRVARRWSSMPVRWYERAD